MNIDPYMMTLAMHNYTVPCIMQLGDPSCELSATWVVYWTHAQETECVTPPMPVCDEHKKLMVMSQTGFWANWLPKADVSCPVCNKHILLDKVEHMPKGE